jgi:hypothetical protein
MKRRILGRRRSMRICFSPAVALAALSALLSAVSLALPRSFFSSAIRPLAGADMSNLPMRVSLLTSPALMAQTIASHWSRRAAAPAAAAGSGLPGTAW